MQRRQSPPYILTWLSVILFLAGLTSIFWRTATAQTTSVVGDGTPASCTSSALATALTTGGEIHFNCGEATHTILTDAYSITTNVTLDGGDLITLDGENLRRIFVVEREASLTLRNVILQHGLGNNGPGGAIWNYGTLLLQQTTIRQSSAASGWAGGAIANDNTGVATIENSVIEDNSAADAAGIYTIGPTLTIRNSIIRNNVVRKAAGFYGGGGILQEINAEAQITVIDSILENNRSNPNGSPGGGIALLSGKLRIEGSTLEANFGYAGGGALYIAPLAMAEIVTSRLINNQTAPSNGQSNYLGGAIFNQGRLHVEASSLSGNQATDGAGVYSGGAGSQLTIQHSTLSHNTASGGGGGLLLLPGNHRIENSTISGNTARIGAALRSGITAGAGEVLLYNVTLVGNGADTLYIDDGSQPVTLQNSIITGAESGQNCNPHAPVSSGGYNLASDASCGLTGTGDQQGVDPLLGELANNGGSTQTQLPQPASSAINAVLGDCPTTDQRGITRPQGPACEAGAVEVVDDAVEQSVPFAHAEIGGVKPSITINPASGYAGQVLVVEGQGAPQSPGVRIAWSQAGQVLNVAEQAVDTQLNYSLALTVPVGLASGPAELCATVTGVEVAEYACTSFTIVESPPATIEGELPADVVEAGNVQVQLLDAAGMARYSAPVNQQGKFAFANVAPGFYNYEVVGSPSQSVAGGVTHIRTGPTLLAGDLFKIGDSVLDPCSFPAYNTGRLSAAPSHETFLTLVAHQSVDALRSQLSVIHPAGVAESNRDDVYFGIYMTGVPLTVEFNADPQIPAGKSALRVRFTVLRADDSTLVIGEPTAVPYKVFYNVGQLPPGKHYLKAEALAANGETVSTVCKSIIVTSGILPAVVNAAGADQANAIVRGFVPNAANPAKGYYFVRGLLPQNSPWPPLPIPNPPPNWPLIGPVDNRIGLRLYMDLEMALDGEVRFKVVRSDIYAKLLSIELCNNSTNLLKNHTSKISYTDPNQLSIPLHGGTLCSFSQQRPLFKGEIEALWGLVSFGVALRVHMDGSISFDGTMRPMVGDIRGNALGEFYPAVIVDAWMKLFWGVAGGGITPRADVVSYANANINTLSSPPYSYSACAAAVVSINVWARVDYLFDSHTWNLWNKRLLEESTCLQAAEALARNTSAEITPPRLIAAPAIASSESGAMLSVYVEDTSPTAPLATAQLLARYRPSDDQPWSEPVAVTDGSYFVQDPAIVFYSGEKAIVSWTETVMTPEEDAAASELSQVLRRQEIFYALWDGASWSTPMRFTSDEAADGSATLASHGRYVTLAWVRDVDGEIAARNDWRIATAQLDGENNQWVTAYLLDAAQSLTTDPTSAQSAGGMNAEVKLAYDDTAAEPTIYAAWTYDADGQLDTGLDRQVVVAHWNVIDEVALNPQPLPPLDWAALNPQPLPPKDWGLLNPQPLPPRVQSPAISIADGTLRLAFLVNPPDSAGNEAAIGVGGELWVATHTGDQQEWQAAALRDEVGEIVIAEAPGFAAYASEQLLLFRRFGQENTTGVLGQLSLSRMMGSHKPSTPIYLTNTTQQQWQGSLTINQQTGQAQIVKVARSVGQNLQAAAILAPATTQRIMTADIAQLSAAADPVETLQLVEGADPALDPLWVAQRTTAVGTPVSVTVVVRNVGRGVATGMTVALYAGDPGSGVLQSSRVVPIPLELNESYVADFTVNTPSGEGAIYAEVTSEANLNPNNDQAVAQIGRPSAPTVTTLVEDALFTGNLRLEWQRVAGEQVAGYRIYRSTTVTGAYEFIGEAADNFYVDLLSQSNEETCYRVSAYTASNALSEQSAPSCNQPQALPISNYSIFLPMVNR